MKKIISAIFKAFGLLFILALVCGFTYWLLQPSLPSGHQKIQDQYLQSKTFHEDADYAMDLLNKVILDLKLPSLSVAVSVNGDVAWACTFGYSDIKEELPSELRTKYRAGSISKSMTGLCAASLVKEGKLDLDRSFYDYVPSYPGKKWDFNLRQLGAHTAGVRHYVNPGQNGFWKEQFSKKHYHSLEEASTIFYADPLLFTPGHGFEYSTHGFTLLAMAIEKASVNDFINTIQENLWTPYKMINTTPDDLTKEATNRAIPYTRILRKLFHTEGPDPSYKWAGGGLLTTPSDLVLMGGAFAMNEVVDSTLEDDLFTPRVLADGSLNPQNYALGWRIDRSSELLGTTDTLEVRHHGGSCPGGSSFVIVLPEAGIAAAAMTNYSLHNSWPLREAMFKIAGQFANSSK